MNWWKISYYIIICIIVNPYIREEGRHNSFENMTQALVHPYLRVLQAHSGIYPAVLQVVYAHSDLVDITKSRVLKYFHVSCRLGYERC